MFKPEDLYKIILENQKNIKDEYKKICEQTLEDAKKILICPLQLYTIHRKEISKG